MVGRNIIDHPSTADWVLLAPSSKEIDLTDNAAVKEFISAHSPNLVIHCAGLVGGIQANIAQPVAFLERNFMIGRNVIMSAYECGVQNLINLASSCMFPRAAINPISEEAILTGELEPTNEGYALAKIFATRLCQYIQKENEGLCYKTIIPCNLYGLYDKFDPANSHLMPAIIHKIHVAKINAEQTVEIWGDGTARREFMFAGDLSNAVIRAANDISSLPDLMNCGLGYDYEINEYYQAVAEVIGWNGEFVHNLNRPVGMKQKLCAIDRQSAWGWSPSTSLQAGISATYNYYLEQVYS